MSDDEVMIDGRPLSTLKVTELKVELENRRLSSKGVKAVLQERLKDALARGDQLEDGTAPDICSEEAQKLTGSEASGTTTPKSELSPSKMPDTSPSKKQTPKRGQKIPETKSDSVSEEVPEPENERTPEIETDVPKSDFLADDNKVIVSEVLQQEALTTNEAALSESNIPEKINKDCGTIITQQTTEKKMEADLSVAPESIEDQTVKEVSMVKREEDDDELDYGDEDEKEQKDEEPMEAEDGKEAKVIKVEEKHESRDKGVKKEEKVRESVSHRRVSSPSSRHPVSNIVHIRGLTRPFTEKQLQNEIEKHGGIIADFWIDKVKSHCFAKMGTSEDAGNVLQAMHNTVWPDGNPKKLAIVFDTEENMTKYKEGKVTGTIEAGKLEGRAERLSTNSQTSAMGGKASLQITLQNVLRDNDKLDSERKEKRGNLASRLTRIDDAAKGREDRKRRRSETPPFSRGAGFMDEKRAKHEERDEGSRSDEQSRFERRVVEEKAPKKSLEQLFKKTVASPPIYYLPLTEQQIAKKSEKKKEKDDGAHERNEKSDRDRVHVERYERSDRDRVHVERNDRGDRGDRGDRSDRQDRESRPRRRD